MNNAAKRNQLNATLIRKFAVTPTLYILEIKPDFEIPNFKPGQYVALGLSPQNSLEAQSSSQRTQNRIVKRTYSIASSPFYKDSLEFYIALVPGGALTPHLLSLEKGDRLFLTPKITGTFTLEPVPQDKEIFLVATGTGIAPFIAMLRTPEIQKRKGGITLLHGVRYPEDLAYREELLQLQKELPNFSYDVVVSRPDKSWPGEKGYVQKLLLEGDRLYEPEDQHVFLCGNPAMIDELEKRLLTLGFRLHTRKSPGNLHLEKYW